MNEQVFHLYTGKKYVAPQRGRSGADAVFRYADRTGTSPLLYVARPAATVRDLKQPRSR